MSVDLDRLLGQTSTRPPSAIDVEAVWARGRRRRRARHAVTAGAAALVLVVGGVGVTGLVTSLAPGDIAPLGSGATPAQTSPPPVAEDEAPAEPQASEEDVVAPEDPTIVDEPGEGEGDAVFEDDGIEEDAAPEDTATEPASPDPARVADPCADHAGREGEAFIDVVSPVPGMEVGAETKFIGCSNVYEATVQWRVVDGGGTTLRDGFVTAECGSGCVGAFSELFDLDGLPGDAVLEVFWEDAADGSDRDLVRIPLATD